jgi:hypothetical protein
VIVWAFLRDVDAAVFFDAGNVAARAKDAETTSIGQRAYHRRALFLTGNCDRPEPAPAAGRHFFARSTVSRRPDDSALDEGRPTIIASRSSVSRCGSRGFGPWCELPARDLGV